MFRKPMPSPRGTNHAGLYLPLRAAVAQDAAPEGGFTPEDLVTWIRENLSPEDVASVVSALGELVDDEGEKDDKDDKDKHQEIGKSAMDRRAKMAGDRRRAARQGMDAAARDEYLKMFPNAGRLV